MTELPQGGAVQSDRPLTRADLDTLLKNCEPAEGQALQLGCPQCGQANLNVAYTNSVLIVACKPCERRLALVVVAGTENQMLKDALSELVAIRALLEQRAAS